MSKYVNMSHGYTQTLIFSLLKNNNNVNQSST